MNHLMFTAIQQYIEHEFNITMTDLEFDQLQTVCDNFDNIYNNSLARVLVHPLNAVVYVGLGETSLKELRNQKGV